MKLIINCLQQSCDRSTPEVSLLLERRSLVVVQADMYENMLHSIAERTSDVVPSHPAFPNVCADSYKAGQILERGTRLSLTIRHVPKTRKLPGLFKVK
ncbi:hypothetical protein B566_EDAN005109 [Ephemera danica]|nr:hypothetical protein B566_EDAN005109 [Ephemera danica]